MGACRDFGDMESGCLGECCDFKDLIWRVGACCELGDLESGYLL